MKYQSLLNDKIKIFYTHKCEWKLHDVERFFKENRGFYFAEVEKYLRENELDLAHNNYENFVKCYEKLLPIFLHSNVIANGEVGDVLKVNWICESKELQDCLKSFTDSAVANIEELLIMTAYLENALGNVYYTLTAKRNPPHLLSDLLAKPEMKDFFGEDVISFLKFLVGTPQSINLRNIVWHGFPKPKEIPSYYKHVLLLSIHSIGCYLEERQFELKKRASIENLELLATNIAASLPAGQLQKSFKSLTNTLQRTTLIDDDYKVYWQHLESYYHAQKYWQLVILILPQIELLLRLLYGNANDYDVRAKLDEYYITMDTIFEKQVPIKPAKANKLLEFKVGIAEATFKCMYDLFVAPNGPRLRDKVSHGEVTLQAINNKTFCDILISIGLQLMIGASNDDYIPHDYESKYHLNVLTRNMLNEAERQLKGFTAENLSIPLSKISKTPMSLYVKIFQRPKKEIELNLVIFKISEHLVNICTNFQTSIATRRELLEQRSLHSKRRTTLKNLLASLPSIFEALIELYNACLNIFLRLQQHVELVTDEPASDRTLRFLKHSLKLVENCSKYSHKDRNEWIKALELVEKYQKTYKQLYQMESLETW